MHYLHCTTPGCNAIAAVSDKPFAPHSGVVLCPQCVMIYSELLKCQPLNHCKLSADFKAAEYDINAQRTKLSLRYHWFENILPALLWVRQEIKGM
jgi:hypothetical protein